jgi:hypothetical protein
MKSPTSRGRRRKSRHRRLGFALATASIFVLFVLPQSALAFGTVWGILEQRSEHERVTRLALQCGAGQQPPDCFQPASLNNLAGAGGSFGAVGAADNLVAHLKIDRDYWHCDNADWANPAVYGIAAYPQSRHAALDKLRSCLAWGKDKLYDGGGPWTLPPASPSNGAVGTAATLVSESGKVDASNPGVGTFNPSCTFDGTKGRAKCNVLEPFGYVLHMAEDFYSHTNWADFSAPGEPVSLGNPYGLGNSDVAPFLDLRGPLPSDGEVPANFTSGCYPTKACAGRIIHGESPKERGLNKDKGLINTTTGKVTDPKTPRGAIVVDGVSNVQRAVDDAVLEVRRQWEVLRAELVQRYGPFRGARMVCALSLDRSEACEKSNLVLAVDSNPPRRGAGAQATVLAGEAFLDHLRDEDSVAVVSFDGKTDAIDVNGFTSPDKARIDAPVAEEAGQEPAIKPGPEDKSGTDPTITPAPETPVDAPPPAGTLTPGDEAGAAAEEAAEARRVSSATLRSAVLRPAAPKTSPALRAAAALLVDGDTPRGQRGVVIIARNATADRGLAAGIRALGNRGAYVSLALTGSGRVPLGVLKAVQATGGVVVASHQASVLRRFAGAAEDAGLSRLDDALPGQAATLAPGNPAIVGVTGKDQTVHPIARPGGPEELRVEALDQGLSLVLTDHATGTERHLRVGRGTTKNVELRAGGDFDVALAGPPDSEYRVAIAD